MPPLRLAVERSALPSSSFLLETGPRCERSAICRREFLGMRKECHPAHVFESGLMQPFVDLAECVRITIGRIDEHVDRENQMDGFACPIIVG